ncbi:glutamate decarboxylase [Lindgomyces ingoldianus]|uniref:Glutamate decarboxylase n=1 Tax=Lindgomyces ingoldianus TaxID=673940 RepID=A0ACB6QUI6_9PLEO|nr:glutamate decarboxylase [Lindgomyces ingoldianus]KAF2469730.1 glutamate decarboxylase [Lindgomyces ingoldianus]
MAALVVEQASSESLARPHADDRIKYPDAPTLHLPYLTESETRSQPRSRAVSRSSTPLSRPRVSPPPSYTSANPPTKLQALAEATNLDVNLIAEAIMVHLNRVATDAEVKDGNTLVDGLESIRFEPADEEDQFTATVYGSRYAAEDLPRYEMPDREMPKEVAYRMIKDDLTLDGTPTLNLASFVTTYMEEEAEKLMVECFSKNFIDYEEYPVSADIQNRCVSMIARLFNIPAHDEGTNAMGTSTIGSSEAIMLAVLAMKKLWQNKRKAEGKPYHQPNIIMNSAVQVCWEKAARYFDVEERYVYCTEDRFVIDPKEAIDLIDENTIGICAILGTTYTGEYEDVKGLNDLLVEKNLDVPIHVDAASGGFVAPFVNPGLLWDFRLPKVVSINVSGHKYGLVYPGVGWVVWRDPKYLPKELVFNINYLGADQASFTLNFSRGASQIIGQYYQMIRLGKRGYRSIMLNLTRTADYLAANLEQLGFIILSERSGNGLPLVAARIDEDLGKQYDEFAIAHQLRERGWVVPAYTMAPHSEKMKLMRIVVREDFTRSRCDALITDIKLALQTLDAMDRKKIEEQKEHAAGISRRATWTGRHNRLPTNMFAGETHSLQGKHGKTHGVC